MYTMDFDIRIGQFRLNMLESVVVKRSVDNLADTATITLPSAVYNKALELEDKIHEGDAVVIKFGYNAELRDLPTEFEGYVESISTDDGSLKINCEDEIYNFRKDLRDKVFPRVRLKDLLLHVTHELGGFELDCDYDFMYDKFTIYNQTGFDVLKKIQEEIKANVYLKDKTLHIHPPYEKIGKKVIYDFAVNIEKSDLKYKDITRRKVFVSIEGTDAKGKTIKAVKGTPGGDKITFRMPGVSDPDMLEKLAKETLKIHCYTGYEGSITGWLIPQVEPSDQVEIRDADYEFKNGTYYVISVETTFAGEGGSRKVTIGKRLK